MQKRLAFLFLLSILVLSYIATPSHAASDVTLTHDSVNVRTSTVTTNTSNVIGVVNAGDKFPYLGTVKDANGVDWYQIDYNSQTGHVISTYSKIEAGLVATKTSIQLISPGDTVGSTVTLNATSEGYRAPEYRFWLRNNSQWTMLRDYAPSGSINYTIANPGENFFVVHTRETGSTINVDTYASIAKTYKTSGVVSSAISQSANTGNVGQPVTISATSSGYANPEYRFWLRLDNVWTIIRDYGTSNSVTYYPTAPGNHYFVVHTKESGALDQTSYAGSSQLYRVTGVAQSSTITLSSGAQVRKPMTITAGSVGYAKPEYRIWLKLENVWTIIQDFSPTPSATYTPNVPGPHYFVVHTRESGATTHTSYIGKTANVTLGPKEVQLIASSDTVYKDSVLRLTANAFNFLDPVYQFVVKEGSNWKSLGDYSRTAAINLTMNSTGTFEYMVRVKEATATVSPMTATKQVTVQPKHVVLVVDPKLKEYPTGNYVNLIAADMGFQDPEYAFHYRLLDGSPWQVIRNFSANRQVAFLNINAGKIQLVVHVREKGATAVEQYHSIVLSYTTSGSAVSSHNYAISFYGKTLEEAAREQLAKGAPVTDLNGSWTKATLDQIMDAMDPLGVTQFDYRKPREPLGTINIAVEVLNVRSTNGTSGTILGQVYAGQVFDVLDDVGGWYQIHFDGKVGWVLSDYVTFHNAIPKFYPLGTTVTVQADYLNVREQPDMTAKVLDYARLNETFMVLNESNGWYKIERNGIVGWVSGTYLGQVLALKTPAVPAQLFQFLDLRDYTGVTAQAINENLLVNKGILSGKGAQFVTASKQYGINEVYLVSHALLETGHGTSALANNAWYNPVTREAKSSSAELTPEELKADGFVQVYNMYGIGAYDSNAFQSGTAYAYDRGWTTPEFAVVDGARWIANQYVNNATFEQYTLYRMRWNYEYTSHQYATDIYWAKKQTYQMKTMYDQVSDYNFKFVFPQYAN